MNNIDNSKIKFLNKLTEIILGNLKNERFGVSELASQLQMSRSNLYLRVKAITGISVSRYIRNIRLEKGQKLLRQTNKTASEVAFDVGFSSTSYFTKCFHDYYGYPPGEYHKIAVKSQYTILRERYHKRNRITTTTIILAIVIAIVLFVIYMLLEKTY